METAQLLIRVPTVLSSGGAERARGDIIEAVAVPQHGGHGGGRQFWPIGAPHRDPGSRRPARWAAQGRCPNAHRHIPGEPVIQPTPYSLSP